MMFIINKYEQQKRVKNKRDKQLHLNKVKSDNGAFS